MQTSKFIRVYYSITKTVIKANQRKVHLLKRMSLKFKKICRKPKMMKKISCFILTDTKIYWKTKIIVLKNIQKKNKWKNNNSYNLKQ